MIWTCIKLYDTEFAKLDRLACCGSTKEYEDSHLLYNWLFKISKTLYFTPKEFNTF